MTSHSNPFGADVQKYWDQRRELFSRFDQGIQLDRESLFSVKPEAAALQIASRISDHRVVDAMCGVGGVAIALARLGKKVRAIDVDERKLAMARHNASIYGVLPQIEFVHADARAYLTDSPTVGAIYLDPPWGGPDYHLRDTFGFRDFSPPVDELLRALLARGLTCAITLPKNFDMRELVSLQRDFELFHSYRGQALLFSTAIVRA